MPDCGTRRLWRFAALWLLLALAGVAQAGVAAPEFHFTQAEFVASDSEAPPHGGWRPQSLPDSWLHSHPGLIGFGWYRMRFSLDEPPPQGMALYVSRAAPTGQFWLNGSVLNPEVRFTRPDGRIGTRTGRKPYLIPLPSGLFRTGENVLHVRLESFGVGGDGLWDVRMGDIERLRVPWLFRTIPQEVVPRVLFVLMVAGIVLGVFALWHERRTRHFLFLSVVALWTVTLGLTVMPGTLPLTRNGEYALVVVLVTLFTWALLHLLYRYSGSDWRWFPRMLNVVSGVVLVCALSLTLFRAMGYPDNFSRNMGLLMVLTAFLRLLTTAMLLQLAWRKRSMRIYVLTGAEVLWFAGYLQVVGILLGWLPPEPFRLDPASALPLYLVLLYLFVERLIRDREEAVRQREAAISNERARILQDMHDGMGSQLVTALRLAKREDGNRALVARSIEESLQDLRLIIDSLDAEDQDLLARLANLRYRLEPRLAGLGIRLDWEVQPMPELHGQTPHSALSILRIVQEALNNAVKHAQASVISVTVARQNGAAVIRIADDGVGLGTGTIRDDCRGLSGMRKRAEQLGATVDVGQREGGGVVVMLRLPPAVSVALQAGAA